MVAEVARRSVLCPEREWDFARHFAALGAEHVRRFVRIDVLREGCASNEIDAPRSVRRLFHLRRIA